MKGKYIFKNCDFSADGTEIDLKFRGNCQKWAIFPGRKKMTLWKMENFPGKNPPPEKTKKKSIFRPDFWEIWQINIPSSNCTTAQWARWVQKRQKLKIIPKVVWFRHGKSYNQFMNTLGPKADEKMLYWAYSWSFQLRSDAFMSSYEDPAGSRKWLLGTLGL